MSTNRPFYVRVGNVGGTPIVADIGTHGVCGGSLTSHKVQLSSAYTLENPPGYPGRPGESGPKPFFPSRLVPAGTTLELLKPEADALVTAGHGTFV